MAYLLLRPTPKRRRGKRIACSSRRAHWRAVPMSANTKGAAARPSALGSSAIRRKLLDLRFLEGDVLARDGIVLLELELLGRGARVLLGHVVVAGVRRAHQLDQDRVGLGHRSISM